MKNLIVLAVIALLLPLGVSAQTGIQFQNDTWDELLAQAKKQDKIIFVDAYAVWCGPCKWMAANAFPDPTVGDFFNKQFINAKIDMEKGEGIDIAETYEVQAYPTLLFVNGDGELVHKGVGARDAEGLIALGKSASNPATQLLSLSKRFEAGERDADFVKAYLTTLNECGMDNTEEVAIAYLDQLSKKELMASDNMAIIAENVASPDSKYFTFMVENKAAFAAEFGEEEVNDRLDNIIAEAFYYEQIDDFSAIKEAYQKAMGDDEEAIARFVSFKMIYYSMRVADESFRKPFVDAADEYFTQHGTDEGELMNRAAWAVYQMTEDKALLKSALNWGLKSVELDPNYNNYDTVAALYYEIGDLKNAKKYATTAVKMANDAGEKAETAQQILDEL